MPTNKQLNMPQEKLLNPADRFHFKFMTTDRWMFTNAWQSYLMFLLSSTASNAPGTIAYILHPPSSMRALPHYSLKIRKSMICFIFSACAPFFLLPSYRVLVPPRVTRFPPSLSPSSWWMSLLQSIPPCSMLAFPLCKKAMLSSYKYAAVSWI